VGDAVLIRWRSLHGLEKEFEAQVRKSLHNKTGVGVVIEYIWRDEGGRAYVYWTKDSPTWEWESDLEVISEVEYKYW